jgi:hypothetical protein
MTEQKATPSAPKVSWGPKWMRGFAAFACGFLLIDSGLQLLGVRIEWYQGLQGFGIAWLTAMTILPFASGIVIGMIYGFGGKYLAHFPPLAVLVMAYYESVYHPLPEGVKLLPWPLWGFFVILMMEFCAFGGVIGELFIRRKMGWDSSIQFKGDSAPLPEDDSDKN